jgi:hypothetical protein
MSIVKDLATDATPSLTCSIRLGLGSAAVVCVVDTADAASPANLRSGQYDAGDRISTQRYSLIGHNNEISLFGIFVRLNLVVLAVKSGTASEK